MNKNIDPKIKAVFKGIYDNLTDEQKKRQNLQEHG